MKPNKPHPEESPVEEVLPGEERLLVLPHVPQLEGVVPAARRKGLVVVREHLS